MEYKGIQLHKNIILYKKDGSINNQVKTGLDRLINMLLENNHVLLSEYKNRYTKVLFDFNCGHGPHWMLPSNYYKGQRCPSCKKSKNMISSKQAKDSLVHKINENNHVLLSEYKNNYTKILIDFKCNHEPHWITPSNYKRGQGCPKCVQSKGEKIICDWLENNNIFYKNGVILSNKKWWIYDIYIPSYNMIIEVHGRQHYQETNYFLRTLKEEQENDRNKQIYAESLGYNYMIVDYREHKPKLTLNRFINQFNNIGLTEKTQFKQYEQLSFF